MSDAQEISELLKSCLFTQDELPAEGAPENAVLDESDSPYAHPGGGFMCMYCGGYHSTSIDCRLPCKHPSGCDRPGIPYSTKDGDTPPLCWKHQPAEGKPLLVPQPSSAIVAAG